MSILYENTLIVKKNKFNRIKKLYEKNGNRIKFANPFETEEDKYIVCFDSNGSLYCDSEKWFIDSLKNVIGYEEDCIEDQEPFFFTYLNGKWTESNKSTLREHYNIPRYFNEKL